MLYRSEKARSFKALRTRITHTRFYQPIKLPVVGREESLTLSSSSYTFVPSRDERREVAMMVDNWNHWSSAERTRQIFLQLTIIWRALLSFWISTSAMTLSTALGYCVFTENSPEIIHIKYYLTNVIIFRWSFIFFCFFCLKTIYLRRAWKASFSSNDVKTLYTISLRDTASQFY